MVLRRDDEPILCGTRDVAVATRFYSAAVDAEITSIENKLAPVLAGFRHQPPGATVGANEAEFAIVHLAMRSGFVRADIERMLSTLLTEVARRNDDPAFMSELIADADQPGFGEGIIEFVQSQLRDMPESDQTAEIRLWANDRRALVERLRTAAVEPETLTNSLNNIVDTLSAVLDIVARNVHLLLVGDTFGVRGRVPALADFDWTVEAAPDGGIVLPDCLAIWISADGAEAQPYVFSALIDPPTVVLPISADRFLLGQRRCITRAEAPLSLNAHLAACSRSLFIARPDHLAATALATRIGSVRSALEQAIAPAMSAFGHTISASSLSATQHR